MVNDPAPFKLNQADVPWEAFRQGRFASEDKDLTHGLAARKLSCVLTRLAPGDVSCPFHFHRVGEELFIVLEGTGTLRFGDTRWAVGPGDVVSCPPGPESAHQFINDGDGPLTYYAISTVEPVDACEYPDSGKVMTWVRDGRQTARYLFRHADADVGYWDGEPDALPQP